MTFTSSKTGAFAVPCKKRKSRFISLESRIFERRIMRSGAKYLQTVAVVLVCSLVGLAQDSQRTRTIVINGQSGEATVFQIGGRQYVDLETVARIANGSISFKGNQIVLNLPGPSANAQAPAAPPQASPRMTDPFMSAAVSDMAIIKDWRTTIANGLTRGVPGDGSRLIVCHDRAAAGLRQATVAASTDSDQSALQLLTNHFDQVNRWYNKMVEARKNMNTGNYSMSSDALNNDSQYQRIASCATFLDTMIPSGTFSDDGSCH
jgi:hypothetical protein